MARFLLFAVPLLVLVMGLFAFAAEVLPIGPDTDALERLGVLRHQSLPGYLLAGTWLLEAVGLTALFLLVQGRSWTWWLDGLVTGWIAWVFRGPLLVLTVGTLTELPLDPWWSWAVAWWFLYPACGLLLADLARRTALER